jgi:hypothetical protein
VAKIVWLAGYPRSGLTWLQFLIGNLFLKPPANSAEMLLAVPDLHRSISAAHLYGDKTIFARMHLAYSGTLPLREDTLGHIYLMRDPFAVIASNAHLALLEAGEDVLRSEAARQALVERTVEEFVQHGGTPREIERGIGTWAENVESWTAPEPRRPRLILRYETLRDEPEATLAQVAQFLHQEKSPAEIATALERTGLAALRAMEEREVAARETGIFYQRRYAAAYPHGLRFLSRGAALDPATLLTPAQRGAFLARCGLVMQRFGYA